jgi:hypothetical protein
MLKKQRWITKATGLDEAAAERFCSLEKVFALSATPVAGDSESIVFRIDSEKTALRCRINDDQENPAVFSGAGVETVQLVTFQVSKPIKRQRGEKGQRVNHPLL